MTFGLTIPLEDNGIGFHIGVNPSYRIAPFFSVEGQISYLYTKISLSFSGREGVNNAMNILAGGRVYVIPESRRTRVYLNLLAGGNWSKDSVTGVETYGEFGFGFSGGGYVEINRFLAGLSYDTPQNLVLKVGYIF